MKVVNENPQVALDLLDNVMEEESIFEQSQKKRRSPSIEKQ